MAKISIDTRLPNAVTWTVGDPMERSSHALAADGRVWLIDPVADEGALKAVEGLGEPAGVLQLLDRHPRDCEELAGRYGVPHLRLPERLDDAPFELRRIVWVPGWREIGLWWPGEDLLVVPEAVGTGAYFAVGGRPAGIHPFLRAWPPGALNHFSPQRLLVGHGPALHEDAAPALAEAVSRSRRDMPQATAALVRSFTPGLR